MITLYMTQKDNPVIITEGAFSTEAGILTLEISLGDYSLTGKIITAVFSQTAVETAPLIVSNGLIQLPITTGLLVAGENQIQLNIREGLTLEQSPIMKWTVGLAVAGTSPAPTDVDIITWLLDGIGGSANVKRFGAIGDGIADDTVAIQAAADSLVSGDSFISVRRGGVLFFPPGTYRKTDTITIKGGTTIQGSGRDTSLIVDDQSTLDGFNITETGIHSAYSITVKDIQLVGKTTASAGIGLNIGYDFVVSGAVMVTFERVDVYGYFNGIGIGNSIGVKFDNILIQNSANDGIITSGSANIVTFSTTYVSYCGRHGFNIAASNYCSFLNTGSDSQGGNGYHLSNSNRLSMISAGAEVITGHALYVDGGTSLTLITCYFNPCVDDVILLNNVNSATIVNCNGVSTGAGTLSVNILGTTANVVVIGGYLTSPLSFTNDYTKFAFINYTEGNGNLSSGTFSQAGKARFATAADDVLQIIKTGVSDYTFCIDVNQTFKIRYKATSNYPFGIEGNAPNNAVTITGTTGTLNSLYGVVLYSPNLTQYKLVVANDGTLTTVAV